MTADYSRALLLASTATSITDNLEQHLTGEVVIVSAANDPGCLRAARILLALLRRLPLRLVLDSSGIAEIDLAAIRTAVEAIDPTRPVGLIPSGKGTRVHIGTTAPAGTLLVVPSQHGAHVIRDGRSIDPLPASALGSSVAAVMAAAEIFKDVLRVRAARRTDAMHTAFCPVTLTNRPEATPALPMPFHFDGALVGLGAIGTGTAMILSELETNGDIDLVDRQRYAHENVTTYSLGGATDAEAGVWKTELAERALAHARCRRFDEGVEAYVASVQGGGIVAPRVVLAGLDSIEARHETQHLWPDLLLDGGTGDTMLGLHVVHGPGRPCMQCFLRPRTAASPYDRLSAITGLPMTKLRDGDAVITDEDLASATEEQRARLAPHVGKKICGLAQAVGLTDIPAEGFQPSAAFVALGAACLVVGRLVAETLWIAPSYNFVQYDALIGAGAMTAEKRHAAQDCYCVQRSTTIERVRERRGSGVNHSCRRDEPA